MSAADTVNVVAGAIGVLIPILVSFLTAHKVVSKRRLGQLYGYASFAVQAAEEIYGTETVGGEIKRRYAVSKVIDKTGLSEEEAMMLVHAAVASLRASGIKPPAEGSHQAKVLAALSPQPTAGLKPVPDAAA